MILIVSVISFLTCIVDRYQNTRGAVTIFVTKVHKFYPMKLHFEKKHSSDDQLNYPENKIKKNWPQSIPIKKKRSHKVFLWFIN